MSRSEIAVIGAGAAGLSVSILLALDGYDVRLIESHSMPGGCAGFFKQNGTLYDVGATTLSGLKPHQPVGRFLHETGFQFDYLPANPGVQIRIDHKTLNRWSDLSQWTTEFDQHFKTNTVDFWRQTATLSNAVWKAMHHIRFAPPQSGREWTQAILRSRPRDLRLVKPFISSVASYLPAQLPNSARRVIDELLLISAQNTASDTPMLIGSLGLDYAAETVYPIGGMGNLMIELMRYAKQVGVYLDFRNTVSEIIRAPQGYRLRTSSGDVTTDRVISTIPIWNLEAIGPTEIRQFLQPFLNRFQSAWGAFTVYIQMEQLNLPAIYHQIHFRKAIPFVHSQSMFVTVSPASDTLRSKAGTAAVTISVHADHRDWFGISIDEYKERRDHVCQALVDALIDGHPQIERSHILDARPGTPYTFADYTSRHQGWVGGLPHAVSPNLLQFPPNRTPLPGFFLAGDTAMPGQGVPAVIHGALRIRDMICQS